MKKALLIGALLAAFAAGAGAWHGQAGVQGAERVGAGEAAEDVVQRPDEGPGLGSGVSSAVLGVVQDGEQVPLCTVTMRMGNTPLYDVRCDIPATLSGERFYVTMHANGLTVNG